MKTRLLQIVAPAILSGCLWGDGPCWDMAYCRIFDLVEACRRTSTCQMSMDVTSRAGSSGDDPTSAASFQAGPGSVIVVPAALFRDTLPARPRLHLTAQAGAPLSSGAVRVLFDDAPSGCEVQPGDDSFEFRCAVPSGITTITFEYLGVGLGVGTGAAAFDLDMFLEETTCTGSNMLCAR